MAVLLPQPIGLGSKGDVVPLNEVAHQAVAGSAATGGEGNFPIIKIIKSERLQCNAIGPIQRAVALGFDNRFFGGPGDDMGSEVIGGDELLLTGIEELVADTQHLVAVGLLGIHADDVLGVNSQHYKPMSVGDTDIHIVIFDKWRPLLGIAQRHGPPKSMAQQQALGRLLTLPFDRQADQVLNRNSRFTTQRQQLRRILLESPQ